MILGVGNHRSEHGCAMNEIARRHGERSDNPSTVAEPFSRMMATINDTQCWHSDDPKQFLCELCSGKMMVLAERTDGTVSIPEEQWWEWMGQMATDPHWGLQKRVSAEQGDILQTFSNLCRSNSQLWSVPYVQSQKSLYQHHREGRYTLNTLPAFLVNQASDHAERGSSAETVAATTVNVALSVVAESVSESSQELRARARVQFADYALTALGF